MPGTIAEWRLLWVQRSFTKSTYLTAERAEGMRKKSAQPTEHSPRQSITDHQNQENSNKQPRNTMWWSVLGVNLAKRQSVVIQPNRHLGTVLDMQALAHRIKVHHWFKERELFLIIWGGLIQSTEVLRAELRFLWRNPTMGNCFSHALEFQPALLVSWPRGL